MKTKFKQIEKLFRPARLVWGGGGPEGPKVDEKPQDKVEFNEKEKWKQETMDKVADRIKSLTLSTTPVQFDLNKGETLPSAVNFKKTLDNKLLSKETELGVKNLSIYLLDGLMRRLGLKVDDVIGQDQNEKGALTKWLNDKKIQSFNIVDGQWVFYTDKEGKTAVQADCVIDQPPTPDKPVDSKAPKPKESKEKFDVTKEVTAAKKTEKDRKEQEAKDAKAEEERLKPENLEKVNSDVPVDLKKDLTLAEFCLQMQMFSTPKDKPVPIKSTEIEAQILKYIAVDSSLKGDSKEKTFSNFMARMDKAGFKQAKIVNGKICFSKDGNTFDNSNPLDASKTVNGAQERVVVYAHEKLEGRAADKAKEDKAKADKASEVKPTKYDGVEQETAKLITGKDKLEKGDLDKVDARYLDAMKAILEYKDGGPATKATLMFIDTPLECTFQKGKTGYELRWGDGDKFYTTGTAMDLKAAQKFFAESLSNGRVTRELQLNNVKNKANFEKYDQVVDSGPTVLKGGKVQYEFDWANGVGGDPDVTIEVLPHGELAVHIDVSGIGMDGEKSYDFRAGTFRDMMRTLKTLQKFVEAPQEEKDKMKQGETFRRFFDKGKDALQTEVSGIDCGKILRVMSVGSTVESKMSQGYYLDMDWMQKLEPAQKVQIVSDGDLNLITVEPRGLILGRVTKGMPAGFRDAMKLVAESKGNMTLKEGPKLMRDRMDAVLKKYNERGNVLKPNPYEDKPEPIKFDQAYYGPGVEVISFVNGNVMLSRDGMASKSFQLGVFNEKGELIDFNGKEFKRAIDQGYFVKDNPNFAPEKAPKKPENIKEDKDFSVTVEKQDEIVDGTLKGLTAKEILTKEVGSGPNWERLRIYVITKMIPINAPESAKDEAAKKAFYQELTWKFMAKVVVDEGLVKDFALKGESPDVAEKKVISNALKAPKFKETFDKDTLAILDGRLKDFPNIRGYIKSLLERVKYDPKGTDDQDKAMQLYRTKMIELAEQTIKDNPIDKAKETQQKYEERIFTLVRGKLKDPESFVKEYKDNAQVKRDYEKATKDFEAGKVAAEGVKKSPHAKTFEEWDKEGRIGVATNAWEALNKTAGVDKKNIWLSRIDYGTESDQKISFNVRYGKAPNERPMTLHFRKGSEGQTMVSASEGWNNRIASIKAVEMKKDKDTVKDVLDYLAGITQLSYAKSGDEKPVGAPVDQPKAPEKPAEPLKPVVGPDVPKPPAAPDKPVDQPKPVGGGGKEAPPKPGAPEVPKGQPTGVIGVPKKDPDKS